MLLLKNYFLTSKILYVNIQICLNIYKQEITKILLMTTIVHTIWHNNIIMQHCIMNKCIINKS